MHETKYAYAVAYMKTLENKMLTQNEIESLITAKDVLTALKILTDKGFGKSGKNYAAVDELLKDELEKVWEEAKNACPDEAPLDVLLYKNDFHNLKTILKSSVYAVEWENLVLRPCACEPQLIDDAIKNNNFEDLPEFIKETAKNGYELITKTGDGQLFEIFVDKSELLIMYELAKQSKNDFLIEWSKLESIVANMKIAARCVGRNKDFIENAIIKIDGVNVHKLIDASLVSVQEVSTVISDFGYQKVSEALLVSFAEFEKSCDNLKINFIKKAKNSFFGFEPIMAFLIGKEYELQALRIILSCKQNDVGVDIIRERLRELYV